MKIAMGKNMKKNFVFALVCAFVLVQFSFAKDVYISPNNDGSQDELVIPLSIKDKRYIFEWELLIQNEKGDVVKHIGNKNRSDDSASTFFRGLTSGEGAKSFFKNLGSAFAPKKGVDVPSEVRWNGIMDNGEVAPDGKYTYFFRAVDDNGNVATSKVHTVFVDSTIPQVTIVQPRESAKIFGSGSKPTIDIKQSGSKEDLWKGTISDSSGKVVKTFTWENSEPLSISWDGKDDDGNNVSEGVYSYQISATDKAGNTSKKAGVNNIIYDAIPRTAKINISGSPFSPHTNSEKSTLAVKTDVPNQNGMTNWKLQVLDSKGKAVKTWSGVGKKNGGDAVISQLDYDGTDDKGLLLPDGEYTLSLDVDYNNGQNPKSSVKFTIDTMAPRATVRCSSDILSPGTNGGKDTIAFSQTASKESNWNAQIVNGLEQEIKKWNFVGVPPETVVWNGVDDNGKLAKDGVYYYELSCVDEAGNSTKVRTESGFTLDTSETVVALHIEYLAFSPNSDNVQDTVCFVPIVNATSGIDGYELRIDDYELKIKDSKGKVVRSWQEESKVPDMIEWNGLDNDGKRCEDGTYSVTLTVKSHTGGVTTTNPQNVVVDRKYPEIAKFEENYTIFNPSLNGKKSEVCFAIKTSTEKSWKFAITDEKGKEVRSVVWANNAENFIWNGTDNNGSKLPDGKYTATLSSMDDAGNKTVATNTVTIDTRPVKAFITCENEAFSPLAENDKATQVLAIIATPTDGIESWNVSIMASDGKIVKKWSTEDQADLPEKITWNGQITSDKNDKNDTPTFANGSYIAKMDIVYAKGDEISCASSSFVCVANEPAVKVQTAPKYFSPDNDGLDDDLFIKLKCESLLPLENWSFNIYAPGENESVRGPLFYQVSGESDLQEQRLIWDGWSNVGESERVQSATDYKYEFVVTDKIGLTSKVEGVIPVDVLVIRDGDLLKIQVPSIVFRSNAADFGLAGEKINGTVIADGLTKEQKANNEKVLKRIAEILNKFKEYNIILEGHTNNISGTEEEGNNPRDIELSKARAEFVKARLVKYGINASRLETVGRGGSQPIVSPGNDKSTNWKNKRVEFILQK